MGKRIQNCLCCSSRVDDNCCFYSEREDPQTLIVTVPALGWNQFNNRNFNDNYLDMIFRFGITTECVWGATCTPRSKICPLGPPTTVSKTKVYYSPVIYYEEDVQAAYDYAADGNLFAYLSFGYIAVEIVSDTFGDGNGDPQRCFVNISAVMFRSFFTNTGASIASPTVGAMINSIENHGFNTRRINGCMGGGFNILEVGQLYNFFAGPNARLAEGGIPHDTQNDNRIIITYTMEDAIQDVAGVPNSWAFVQQAFCGSSEGFSVTW